MDPHRKTSRKKKDTIHMKRTHSLDTVLALALSMLMLAACGKSSFGLTDNTETRMTITAENADKDASFVTGSLKVEDGEAIVISSDLTKGSIRVELVGMPEEQSIDEIPEMDGEATLTANLHATDGTSGTVPAGSYLLWATCLEEATGTVQIEVKPAA